MTTIKFACIPAQYAPKRKMIDFALPKWRTKLAEFNHPDLVQWAHDLYQTKVFKTREEFNEAYDLKLDKLYWRNKPMVINADDIAAFEADHQEGAFDDGVRPELVDKLIKKLRALRESGDKVFFVY